MRAVLPPKALARLLKPIEKIGPLGDEFALLCEGEKLSLAMTDAAHVCGGILSADAKIEDPLGEPLWILYKDKLKELAKRDGEIEIAWTPGREVVFSCASGRVRTTPVVNPEQENVSGVKKLPHIRAGMKEKATARVALTSNLSLLDKDVIEFVVDNDVLVAKEYGTTEVLFAEETFAATGNGRGLFGREYVEAIVATLGTPVDMIFGTDLPALFENANGYVTLAPRLED